MVVTINPTFKDRQVSHHGICKKIGDHTADELKDLAIEARRSNNPLLIECFKELPSLKDLLEDKTAAEIAIAQQGAPSNIPVYNTEDAREDIVVNNQP